MDLNYCRKIRPVCSRNIAFLYVFRKIQPNTIYLLRKKNATNCMTAKLYKSFFYECQSHRFFFLDFFAFLPFFVTFFKLRASINRLRLTTKQNQVLGRQQTCIFFSSSATSQTESLIFFSSQNSIDYTLRPLGLGNLIPSRLVLAEFESAIHVSLPIDQFEPVQQSRS